MLRKKKNAKTIFFLISAILITFSCFTFIIDIYSQPLSFVTLILHGQKISEQQRKSLKRDG
jgi:hypothetical protein